MMPGEAEERHVLTTLCSLQYYTALTELFLPLALTDGHETMELFNEYALDSARQGAQILHQLMQMGLCRYMMPLSSFYVLHICDAIARCSPDPTEQSDMALLCLHILEQNRQSFKLNGPLQQLFRIAMEEYHVELPIDMDERFGPIDQYSIDEVLDAATRLSYAQPTRQITRWIHEDFASEWQEFDKQMPQGQARSSSTLKKMRLDEVLN